MAGCQWVGLSAPGENSPGAYPASCSVGTRSFLGVNWLKKEYSHTSILGLHGLFLGELYLSFILVRHPKTWVLRQAFWCVKECLM